MKGKTVHILSKDFLDHREHGVSLHEFLGGVDLMARCVMAVVWMKDVIYVLKQIVLCCAALNQGTLLEEDEVAHVDANIAQEACLPVCR